MSDALNIAMVEAVAGPVRPRQRAHRPPTAFFIKEETIQPTTLAGYRLEDVGKPELIEDLEELDEEFGGGLYGTREMVQIVEDSSGRRFKRYENGLIETFALSSVERKREFQLKANIQGFVDHYGRDRVLFCTMTPAHGETPREFAKRWNSFLTHHGMFIVGWIKVVEPQKSGLVHYHFLLAVGFDVKPDEFDWESFYLANPKPRKGQPMWHHRQEMRTWRKTAAFREATRKYVESAPVGLRRLWKLMRDARRTYGLGRSELLPMRKGSDQIANYVGSYLSAGDTFKRDEWKGVRRVELSRKDSKKWKRCHREFSWCGTVSGGAEKFRRRLGYLGAVLGIGDDGGSSGGVPAITRALQYPHPRRKDKHGKPKLVKSWLWKLRKPLLEYSDEEFDEFLASKGRALPVLLQYREEWSTW